MASRRVKKEPFCVAGVKDAKELSNKVTSKLVNAPEHVRSHYESAVKKVKDVQER